MSCAKSRDFRRRSGDDEDEEANTSITPSTTKINGTPSTAKKPSTTNKPRKPTSQLSAKSLLSFADDDDEESPFSRPPPKSSSSSSSPHSKSSLLTNSPPQKTDLPLTLRPHPSPLMSSHKQVSIRKKPS